MSLLLPNYFYRPIWFLALHLKRSTVRKTLKSDAVIHFQHCDPVTGMTQSRGGEWSGVLLFHFFIKPLSTVISELAKLPGEINRKLTRKSQKYFYCVWKKILEKYWLSLIVNIWISNNYEFCNAVFKIVELRSTGRWLWRNEVHCLLALKVMVPLLWWADKQEQRHYWVKRSSLTWESFTCGSGCCKTHNLHIC